MKHLPYCRFPTVVIHHLLLASVALCALVALPAVQAQQENRDPKPNAKELTPQQKEMQRVNQIMAWARKANPTQNELLTKMYEPVYKGNQQDARRNQQFAQKCAAQAELLAKQDNAKPQTIQQWQQSAKLYQELAQQNQIIVKMLEDGGFNLSGPYAAIAEIETKIAQLTGKKPPRDWFMPSDFQRTTVTPTARPPAPPAAKN